MNILYLLVGSNERQMNQFKLHFQEPVLVVMGKA